ncbi:MAG: HEAT repeat domain-containing protein [Armatimonadetes bacterium]|jgi:HEAT repeat protein|nr:HEAT repeat domain-containing protein [Armatimonadota bacterium]
MARNWWDRLIGRDEEEEYDAFEVTAHKAVVEPEPAPVPAPVIEEPEASEVIPTSRKEPTASAWDDPLGSAPTFEQPSAVRQIATWAPRETVTLLNDLTGATRERVAEALVQWHEADQRLQKILRQAREAETQTRELVQTQLADPDFEGEAGVLSDSITRVASAVNALSIRNRARVREWIISAVYGHKSWSPSQLISLFDSAGCGPLTLADLQPRLRSMEASQRQWAAAALGEMSGSDVAAALLNLLRDPDSEVRSTAVASFGKLGDATSLQHLGSVIKRDPDWAVRLRSIDAACGMEGFEAIGFLHELLRDKAWWRELEIGAWQIDSSPDLSAGRRIPAADVRTRVVDSILSKVQAALPVAGPAHRSWLMEVLGDTGDARAVPILSSGLQDAELEVRLRAIRGLGLIGGSSIAEIIIPCLKDQQPQVRMQAAQALGDANDFRAVEPLLEAMRDTDQNVRGAVAVAIGRIVDTRALKPLLTALNDPDKDVREQTQLAVRRMSDPRTLALVEALLQGTKRPS